MNEILKAAKLDFSLIKPYIKTLLFIAAFPVVFSAINRSLVNGISFAMSFISMTAGYTFSISEKNGMERLYGILPVSKKHLVIGRYLYTCMTGVLVLVISIIIHPIVLRVLGAAVSFEDIIGAAITGIVLFSLYTVFLLPGYYKYGAIKGRIFIFVPAAGYLIVLALVYVFGFVGNPALPSLLDSPLILVTVVLLICIMAFLLSLAASIRIFQNKEA